uniref:Uncharacterized protein n=1 Tax=Panagrolaimus sp. JU765 TaxID=591449 RepID=A0AC34QA37_9BILA
MKPIIFFLIFVQIFLVINAEKSKNSTLGVRLSLSGLQFFSNIGHKIVTKELPRLALPDINLPITGGPGDGNVYVSDMKLQKFESPKFRFYLAPDKGITWRSTGGALKLTGNWNLNYTWVVRIPLSGTVDITASDIRSVLTLGAYGYQEHPQIAVYNCTTSVIHLHMSLSGGVIPWIINLFKTPLSAAIKSAIHEEFCDLTRTVLLREANNALMKVPTHVEITENIYMDYGLIHNPVITKKYIQGDALIDVTIGNKSCDLEMNQVEMIDPGTDDYMANIWFSQSILDCIFKSAHEQNMFKFVVDKNLQKNLTQFLKTTCSRFSVKDICFGTFFKKLREDYPNQYIDMVFKSGMPPTTNIDPQSVNVSTLFFIDIHINPYTKNPEPLARLSMSTLSDLEPYIFNDRIVGELQNTDNKFQQVFSTIGDFNPLFLKALELILKPMITVAVDTAFRIGIPIPLVENVTFSNTTNLVKLDKQFRIDSNLSYLKI